MRTPLLTLTLTLALSLAGMASADVYKCPAPGGKTIYQDAPCSVETVPMIREQSSTPAAPVLPSPPPALTHMHATLECASLGEIAATIARGRENGTVRLRLITAMQRATKDETIKAMMETLVKTIYASDMTPRTARQVGYDMCMASVR